MGARRCHLVNRRAPTPALPQRGRGQSPGLLPQGQALRHAKAVLLVDDCQAQARELHLRLDDGVRADDQRRRAALDGGQHGRALFFLLAAGEPGHLLPARGQQGREPLGQLGKVLLGQDLGGRHEGGLVTAVDRAAGGERGDDGLAAADIALQQALHRMRALQIATDLGQGALLCGRQGERQRCAQRIA